MAAADERTAIEAVIRDYLEGMIYGQYDRLERAMDPRCHIAGHYQGQYDFDTRDEFIAVLKTLPAQKPGSPFTSAILSIDISGDSAIAKVTDDCFGTRFTDYLTFIKDGGQWRIVMKAFFDHANGGKA